MIGSVAIAVALVAFNLKPAYREGMIERNYVKGFLAGVKAGQMPISFLAGKWGGNYWVLDPEGIAMRRLRDAHYGDFGKIPDESVLLAIPFVLADQRDSCREQRGFPPWRPP